MSADPDFIERVAEALHLHANHDDPLYWNPATEGQKKYALGDVAKKSWRECAVRFTEVLLPKVGLRMVREGHQ